MTYLVGQSGIPGYSATFAAPPLVASLSWVNQGTATATDDAGTMLFTANGPTANDRRLLVQAAPATPYTFTVGLHPGFDIVGANTPIVGIVSRESSTGKFVEFIQYSPANNTIHLGNDKFTNPTTPAGGYADGAVQPIVTGSTPVWLRVVDDGANLTWYYSANGREFFQWDQRSRTDHMAGGPNQIGLVADSYGGAAGTKVKARIFHFYLGT
jgi:hypothetical protein